MPRKGLYERAASVYRDAGGFVAYALSLRMDSVIFLLSEHSPEKVTRALAAGLRVWFYAGPDAWRPHRWRATRDSLKAVCATNPQIIGYVADAETWSEREDHPTPHGHEWDEVPDSEVDALAAALHEDSLTLSVGFTSFPSWPRWQRIARAAPHVWGSPQLYGIVSPAPPPTLLRRGNPWRSAFAGYCPSLAAWGRNAPEQRAYLRGMASLPNVMFWHTHVATNDTFAALRDFTPGVAQGTWRSILAALGIGVVGGLITWGITEGGR